MWPFKRKPKADMTPTKPEPPKPEPRGIPTIHQKHEDLRAMGYEPVGDDDGPIKWVKRERAQ